jgi:hypothetical protein
MRKLFRPLAGAKKRERERASHKESQYTRHNAQHRGETTNTRENFPQATKTNSAGLWRRTTSADYPSHMSSIDPASSEQVALLYKALSEPRAYAHMVNWVNVELYHIDPHLSQDQKARACRVFRINLAADLRPISRRKVCGCAPCSRSLACHLSLSLSLLSISQYVSLLSVSVEFASLWW